MTSDERAAAGRKGAVGLTVEGVETWAGRVSGDGMGLTACSSFALAVYGARAGCASFLCGGFAVGRWDGGIACGANTEGTEEGGTEVFLGGEFMGGVSARSKLFNKGQGTKKEVAAGAELPPGNLRVSFLRALRVCRRRLGRGTGACGPRVLHNPVAHGGRKSFPMIGKFFSNGWKKSDNFSNDWKKFSGVFQ